LKSYDKKKLQMVLAIAMWWLKFQTMHSSQEHGKQLERTYEAATKTKKNKKEQEASDEL